MPYKIQVDRTPWREQKTPIKMKRLWPFLKDKEINNEEKQIKK